MERLTNTMTQDERQAVIREALQRHGLPWPATADEVFVYLLGQLDDPSARLESLENRGLPENVRVGVRPPLAFPKKYYEDP